MVIQTDIKEGHTSIRTSANGFWAHTAIDFYVFLWETGP